MKFWKLCAFVLKAQITNMYISNMFCTYIVTYDRTMRDILSLLYLDIEDLVQVSHDSIRFLRVSHGKKVAGGCSTTGFTTPWVISTQGVGFQSRWDGLGAHWGANTTFPTSQPQQKPCPKSSKNLPPQRLEAKKTSHCKNPCPEKDWAESYNLKNKLHLSVDSSILRADMILFLLDWLPWIPKNTEYLHEYQLVYLSHISTHVHPV